MSELNQIKVAQALTDAAATIRQYADENVKLAQELAEIKNLRRCEKLASVMIEKGLTGDKHETVVGVLLKQASDGKLDETERSVAMVAPDMWSKMAQTYGGGAGVNQGAMHPFERSLLGG